MAAPLARCALSKSVKYTQIRRYSIEPPIWLGGSVKYKFRQLKNEPDPHLPTFKQRMDELNTVDPDLNKPINIGVPFRVPTLKREKVTAALKNKKDEDLEQAARLKTLKLATDEVKEDWLAEYGPVHAKVLAAHYGIFRDLFNDASFVPVLDINICFDYDDEYVTPVYRGNKISPSEALTAPHVEFEASEDSLWTLLLTNPDGHLADNQSEYVHWFVGNIPGSEVSNGEVLCDYLRPFPPKGTGLHRHIFVLFKQEKHIDYSKEKRPPNCSSLHERSFRTVDFYKAHQEELTPLGLKWFQSDWDDSVREVYHHVFDMEEPSYEYMFPPHYLAPLIKYPHREPFDRYYDRYRDRKDLAEEVLRLKLEMISPSEPHPPRPKYPLIHRDHTKPTWLKRKEELMHRRVEQYKDLP